MKGSLRSRPLDAAPAAPHPLARSLLWYRAVNLEYALGSALALALTVYLVYALLRPEKF